MKKTLFVSALAGVMSLGLVGCSDDKEGVDGASSAEEAFEILCEDFLVGCEIEPGYVVSNEDCQTAYAGYGETGMSDECGIASAKYSYCVMKEYPGDPCSIYGSEDDMSGLSESEAMSLAMACMSEATEVMTACEDDYANMNNPEYDYTDPSTDMDPALPDSGDTGNGSGDNSGNTGDATESVEALCNTYIVGCDNGEGGTYSLDDCKNSVAEYSTLASDKATCEQYVVDMAQCGLDLLVAEDLSNRCDYAGIINFNVSDDAYMTFYSGCSSYMSNMGLVCYQ